MPAGVTDAMAAICTAESWPRDGATVPPAEPTLPTAASLGGIAGMADTLGDATSATAGATSIGFGCNSAGSSSFTTGACVHADNKIAVAMAIAISSVAVGGACITGPSGRRDKVFVTLVFPFKLQKIVIATGAAIGIIPAYRRAPFINRATTLGLVKKHAH